MPPKKTTTAKAGTSRAKKPVGGPSHSHDHDHSDTGATRFPLDDLLNDEGGDVEMEDKKPDLGNLNGYGALGAEGQSWAEVIRQGYLAKGKEMEGSGKGKEPGLGDSVKTIEVSERSGLFG